MERALIEYRVFDESKSSRVGQTRYAHGARGGGGWGQQYTSVIHLIRDNNLPDKGFRSTIFSGFQPDRSSLRPNDRKSAKADRTIA